MAGMLPGVESARRRRFHLSGGSFDSPSPVAAHGGTRKSSFCLYTTNHHSQHQISMFSHQRSMMSQANQDEKLEGVAQEAKERLNERLKTQNLPNSKRNGNNNGELSARAKCELQTEVYGSKKRSGFMWRKLKRSRLIKQDECCVVCLEQYKLGETLVYLPCAHKFHGMCLLPWLQNNSHCPCCRMEIKLIN